MADVWMKSDVCVCLSSQKIFSSSSGTRDAVVFVPDKFGFSMHVKFKVLACSVKLGFSLMSLNRDASPEHLCFHGCVKTKKRVRVCFCVLACLRLHRRDGGVSVEGTSVMNASSPAGCPVE